MSYILHFPDGSERYLAHYGVKGMKWGVWNAETRARYLGEGDGTGYGGGGIDEEDEDKDEDLFNPPENSHIDPLAALKDHVLDLLGRPGHNVEYENAQIRKEHPEAFPYKETSGSETDDMMAVNPQRAAVYAEKTLREYFHKNASELKTHKGNMTNCATCSVTYDLRRRGYDVRANSTERLSLMHRDIGKYYDGAKFTQCNTASDLERQLKGFPNGARGALSGTTIFGSGHSIAWEKKNGKITYRDCQSGKMIKDLHDIYVDENHRTFQTLAGKHTIDYVRLDDKKPNLKAFYDNKLVSPSGKPIGKSKGKRSKTRSKANPNSVVTTVRKTAAAINAANRMFKKEK